MATTDPAKASGRVGAAVDLGSNSVHLLVARFDDDGLHPIHDESVLLGLGEIVDRDGRLGGRRSPLPSPLSTDMSSEPLVWARRR